MVLNQNGQSGLLAGFLILVFMHHALFSKLYIENVNPCEVFLFNSSLKIGIFKMKRFVEGTGIHVCGCSCAKSQRRFAMLFEKTSFMFRRMKFLYKKHNSKKGNGQKELV